MNKMSGFFGLVVAILVLLEYTEAQTVYTVGDGLGWRVPPNSSAYQDWASGKNFSVGNILSFNFVTQQHNVIQVPENSYSSCSSANSIGTIYNSTTNITLTTVGQHYYICGISNHCNSGQRLAINVSASNSSAVPPTAPPPPPSSSASSTSFFHFLFFITVMLMAF